MSRFTVYTQVGEYTPFHITAANATSFLSGVGKCVALSQTLGSAIIAGQVNTVALSTVQGLYAGQLLNVAQGGTHEDVRVLTVDPLGKTFTASFQNGYTGSINVTSRTQAYLGGIVVNQPGSGVTITLSNGHPNMVPNPTDPRFGPVAVLQPAALGASWYWAECVYGLFIEVAGTTIGDYTLLYRDMPV
jgi:hypothetical protein